MSDVTVAQPGAAPSAAPSPAPAPAQQQVPINENPTSTPNPIGSQAPSGQEPRSDSAREAIQRAYERANNPPAKTERPQPTQRAAPKPAEAKPGHNQPPEETPKEKIDLRKRPNEQPAQHHASEQPRDRGRFAPRTPDERTSAPAADGQQAAQAQAAAQQQPYKKLPPHAPYAEPPVRISERARRDWADTPESVRGDIHRLQGEFAKAYQYYKADYEAFKPLKPYHEMAQRHGTTLDRALGNYISMENKLRQDVVGGLDVIVNNLQMFRSDGSQVNLRDIAYYILSQSPEQLQQLQSRNVQQAAGQQIGALHQKIEGLEKTLNQMHTQAKFTYTRSAVDQFAASHPRFDELGDIIEQELKWGFDLDTAYARAALLRPATHAAQTRTTPAQTRPTDRSIYGAPDVTASDAASRRPREASPTNRAALQNAARRLNGAL
jgi:hypothetical protein